MTSCSCKVHKLLIVHCALNALHLIVPSTITLSICTYALINVICNASLYCPLLVHVTAYIKRGQCSVYLLYSFGLLSDIISLFFRNFVVSATRIFNKTLNLIERERYSI